MVVLGMEKIIYLMVARLHRVKRGRLPTRFGVQCKRELGQGGGEKQS